MNNLFNIHGNIFITNNDKNFVGPGRISLLENIEVYGSISKAAKAMKMSYKAAWDSIDMINKLSPTPLVIKVSGGKGGGGTVITSYAKELIFAFKEIEELNKNYLETLSQSFNENINKDYKEAPTFTRLKGLITSLKKNNKNFEVKIELNSNQYLYSINSEEFINKKNLKLNDEINFLIETSAIVLHSNKYKNSARNLLKGEVIEIKDDGINSNISIDCKCKDIIHAKITSASCKNLEIIVGKVVYAQFKAYNITII